MASEISIKISNALSGLLVQLPSLLTMLGCIVCAIVRWRRHPRVSLLVLIGLSLMIVHAVAFAFVFAFVPDLFATPGNYTTIRFVITVISFIYNASLAILLGILLFAVFTGRSRMPGLAATRATLV